MEKTSSLSLCWKEIGWREAAPSPASSSPGLSGKSARGENELLSSFLEATPRGISSAKSRLWETPGNKWSGFFNKNASKQSQEEKEARGPGTARKGGSPALEASAA